MNVQTHSTHSASFNRHSTCTEIVMDNTYSYIHIHTRIYAYTTWPPPGKTGRPWSYDSPADLRMLCVYDVARRADGRRATSASASSLLKSARSMYAVSKRRISAIVTWSSRPSCRFVCVYPCVCMRMVAWICWPKFWLVYAYSCVCMRVCLGVEDADLFCVNTCNCYINIGICA